MIAFVNYGCTSAHLGGDRHMRFTHERFVCYLPRNRLKNRSMGPLDRLMAFLDRSMGSGHTLEPTFLPPERHGMRSMTCLERTSRCFADRGDCGDWAAPRARFEVVFGSMVPGSLDEAEACKTTGAGCVWVEALSGLGGTGQGGRKWLKMSEKKSQTTPTSLCATSACSGTSLIARTVSMARLKRLKLSLSR